MALYNSSGSYTNSSTLTVASASNRVLLIFVAQTEDSRPISTVTWGGNNVGQSIAEVSINDSTADSAISVWAILESEIAANNGGVIVVTNTLSPGNVRRQYVLLENAAQSYTLSDSASNTEAAAPTTFTDSVTVPSSGVAVAAVAFNHASAQGASLAFTNGTIITTQQINTTVEYGWAYSESAGTFAPTPTISASDSGAIWIGAFNDVAGSATYPQNRGRLIGTGTIGQGNGFGYKRF